MISLSKAEMLTAVSDQLKIFIVPELVYFTVKDFLENREQKPKERDLGAAEAYFGTAAEDPIDGLLIKTAHTAPTSRCSSENCDDPSCPSSQNFCQAFMEWLEQRFGDDHADGPSSMRRTYENDEAMAFVAMEKQFNNDPNLLDHMVVDSGSNNHHYPKYSLLKVNSTKPAPQDT